MESKGSVQKDMVAVSVTEVIVDSNSPAPKTQTQIDGRKPLEGFGTRGGSPSGRKCQGSVQKQPGRELHESVV